MNKANDKKTWISALSIVIALALTLSVSTFAWFSLQKSSKSASFYAGKLSGITLEVATVPAKGTVIPENPEKTYNGEESERAYTLCENNIIGISEQSALANVELRDMSFGSIDNLAKLKPENTVYLRLTIPKALGKSLKLSIGNITENGYFFELYKNNGDLENTKITDNSVLDGLLKIATGDTATSPKAFLKYSYCYSSYDYSANTLSQEESAGNLEFGVNIDGVFTKGGETDFSNFNEIPTEEFSCPNDVFSASGENYYLYVKINPNLDAFALSIEHLSILMPCFMLFHVGISFEEVQITEVAAQ